MDHSFIRKSFAVLLLTACAFAFTECSGTKEKAFKRARLQELMDFCRENGLYNGTILVAEKGKVLYKDALGYADFNTNQKLQLESQFYLASVSKQMTDMAVMILMEHGKLSYDDPLSLYFPEFPSYADTVTIRHMMTHTSGIPDHFQLGVYKPGLTNEDVLAALVKVDTLNFKPGERFRYSNGGYVLLSMIVEKVSGMPFHIFMKKNIFDPLGMENTLVYDRSRPEMEHRAIGFDGAGGLADYDILTTGAGGIFSNVEDLFLWDRALYDHKLVSEATLQEAFTPAKLNDGNITEYGFGWVIHEEAGRKTVQHSGGLAGFSTFILRDLGRKNTIIYLTNNGGGGGMFPVITEAIQNILRGRPFDYPKIPVAYEMRRMISERGIEAAIDHYRKLKENRFEEFDFSEMQLNMAGYLYLQDEDYETALALFRLNMEEFPDAFNTYDSYAEALMMMGELEKAIEYYQKSLELNPGNTNATYMIKKIRDQG